MIYFRYKQTQAIEPVFKLQKQFMDSLYGEYLFGLLLIHFLELFYMILLDQDLFFIEVIFNVFIFIDKCTHRR